MTNNRINQHHASPQVHCDGHSITYQVFPKMYNDEAMMKHAMMLICKLRHSMKQWPEFLKILVYHEKQRRAKETLQI